MLIQNIANDMIFAAIPAVGFALLFNVPKSALKYCASLGALGHGCRTLLIYFDLAPIFATFIAAGLVGLLGAKLSQHYLAHPKVFTVAAIIPMIPGIYAYKAMIALVQIHHHGFSDLLFQQMVNYFLKTAFSLGALVFGLALPGLLFYRQKPLI